MCKTCLNLPILLLLLKSDGKVDLQFLSWTIFCIHSTCYVIICELWLFLLAYFGGFISVSEQGKLDFTLSCSIIPWALVSSSLCWKTKTDENQELVESPWHRNYSPVVLLAFEQNLSPGKVCHMECHPRKGRSSFCEKTRFFSLCRDVALWGPPPLHSPFRSTTFLTVSEKDHGRH